MQISLFPTPFDHFHFHPTLGLDPALILTLRLKRRELGRTDSKHLKQVSTVLLSSQILMFLYFIARVTHICRTCINTYITCGRAHQAPPPSLFFFTKVPFILKCVWGGSPFYEVISQKIFIFTNEGFPYSMLNI